MHKKNMVYMHEQPILITNSPVSTKFMLSKCYIKIQELISNSDKVHLPKKSNIGGAWIFMITAEQMTRTTEEFQHFQPMIVAPFDR